jgi:uncharacterized membrane protein (DUF106 family)
MNVKKALIILVISFIFLIIFAIFLKNWSDNRRLLELKKQQEIMRARENEFERRRRENENGRLQLLSSLNQQKSDQISVKDTNKIVSPKQAEDQRLQTLNKLSK